MFSRIITSSVLALVFSIFLVSCGDPKGNFGWAVSFEEGTSELDKDFNVQTEFTMTREDLIFSPQDTIHFVYVFDSGASPEKEFYFSLNKKSIDYLEIDLRRKMIEEGNAVIRDSYIGLGVGEYLLKAAFEGDVFDQVEFKVLPEDGFFTESLERDLSTEIEDEIIRYSR
ncbi:hypothetical protein [Leptospira sp. GIMC2001]|uniref:hypothetical protein n=1 Tax=Leptospira sp. GIMC2001 TaxID=1513297 RepID=UPI00234A68EC|nr:hypothetical protein [Leptospira sp. GIMC2001]WCL49984.1 hypothetical protein O4O04_03965 [Leptospira sp. GIMC2001]